MKTTPRTDALFHQFGPEPHPGMMAYYSLCRELEEEAISAQREIRSLRSVNRCLSIVLRDLEIRAHSRYDFNADPDNMTLRVGNVLRDAEGFV